MVGRTPEYVGKKIEGDEQDPRHHCRVVQQVGGGPEEVHALQEAQEQRRVAQRRQRAADVGHQEDEEHDGVHIVPPVVIGAQQRTDQHHGGAGGADQARDHSANGEDEGIDRRGPLDVPGHQHAAGDREQGEQQDDEGDVLQQSGMDHLMPRRRRAVYGGEGHHEGERPEQGDLTVMVMPEVVGQQRKQGDRQQHACKRDGPKRGQPCPVQRGQSRSRDGGRGGQRERKEGQGKDGR